MMMMKRSSDCGICENANRASICAGCVNYRLKECNTWLATLKSHHDTLYSRISELLVAKGKAKDQQSWMMLRNEKLTNLRENLRRNKEQLQQRMADIEKLSYDLKARYCVLELAHSMVEKSRVGQMEKHYPNLIRNCCLAYMEINSERLHKQSLVVKQICKLFPISRVSIDRETKDGCGSQYNQICNARLPRGLNPHSVPPKELAASLGYMLQLVNLLVCNLAVPALHNSGYAGSCSRIWERNSYWDAGPLSRSNEFPLFVPRLSYCSASTEDSWTTRSSSNFGVASMESDRSSEIYSSENDSFSCSCASPCSAEAHRNLQKGIALLKKSVACTTAYCYNSLYLEVPYEASTFEAFAKLLATLSSSKEVRSVLSSAFSRSAKQGPQMNKAVWNVNSASSSTLLDSTHTMPILRSTSHKNLWNSAASYVYATEIFDSIKNESLIDEWDFVAHPSPRPQATNIRATSVNNEWTCI